MSYMKFYYKKYTRNFMYSVYSLSRFCILVQMLACLYFCLNCKTCLSTVKQYKVNETYFFMLLCVFQKRGLLTFDLRGTYMTYTPKIQCIFE